LAEHVFVVDDDDNARAALAQSLAGSGYAVQAFSSIEALIERRHKEEPACVVLDYYLPGPFTTELRRKLLGDRGLSVIFVTSYADVPTVVKAMKNGAVDFLTKPVDAEQLAAAVSRGMERSRRAQADRQSQRAFLERLAPSLASLLAEEPDQMVLVGGHTDDRALRGDGRFASNWELSAARALAVTRVLTGAGLPPTRVLAAGFGAEHPRVPNADERARRKNRRIEVLLVPIHAVASR